MTDFSRLKLLIVDDEPDLEVIIRQRFKHIIQGGNAEFYFASNGKDALNQLSDHQHIDIVLSDINMPIMDGLTLLDKVTKKYPQKEVIIVSAYGDKDNISAAKKLGAYDFIVKPFKMDDLETTINNAYEQVKKRKAN